MNIKKALLHGSILFLLWIACVGNLKAENVMSITGGQVAANGVITIQVSIANADAFIAFQLDIPLPGPLGYVAGSAALNPTRANGHSLSAQIINGNVLRIIAYSVSNAAFLGTSGSVMSFQLMASTLPGNYALLPVNPIIAGTGGGNILTSAVQGTVTILAPNIQAEPTTLDFGETPLQSYSDRSFMIHNQGNQTLNVTAIQIDGPYFSVQGSTAFTIVSGGSRQIILRFTPGVKGHFSNILAIHSNDPDSPVTSITLEAVAYAVNELHTGNMLSFSGQNNTLSFSINNMEPFVAFQFDLVLPEPLTYIAGSATLSARKTDHGVSANLINDNTLRVVAFSPSNQSFAGTGGEILKLAFEVFGQGGWYPLNLTEVIITDLSGENILSDSYSGFLEVSAPDIHSEPSLHFGDVSILETASRLFRIYNYGSDALVISGIQFTNPDFFSLAEMPIAIPAGAYIDLEVLFHDPQEGLKDGILRILSNDPDEYPYQVSLSANAFTPNYMRVQNSVANPVDTIFVDILVDNHSPFVAFEFRLNFPAEVMTFLPEASHTFLTERAADHQLVASIPEAGVLRVFSYSIQNQPFSGNTGSVVRLGFGVEAPQIGLEYPLTLTQAILADSQGKNILYAAQNGSLTIADSFFSLEVKLILEGSFNPTGPPLMKTLLTSSGAFPLSQPFAPSLPYYGNAFPVWYYDGHESISSIPAGVVDWVLLELRDAPTASEATSSTAIARRAALLMNTGEVVGTDGQPPVFELSLQHSLFVVVYHRNHLAVMSAQPLISQDRVYAWDFTQSLTKAYSPQKNNAFLQGIKDLGNGYFGLYGGDGDGNGQIQTQDKNNIWNPMSGLSGYLPGDFDMNGQVQTQDKNNIWNPNSGMASQIP